MPDWKHKIDLHVNEGAPRKNAQGVTSFGGWAPFVATIRVWGSGQEMAYDVIPHETTHCVIGTWWEGPVPRWADEGIAQMSESEATKAKFRAYPAKFTAERIMALKNYNEAGDIGAWYTQSFVLVEHLVGKMGKREFLAALKAGDVVRRAGYHSQAELEADCPWRKRRGQPRQQPVSEPVPGPEPLRTDFTEEIGRLKDAIGKAPNRDELAGEIAKLKGEIPALLEGKLPGLQSGVVKEIESKLPGLLKDVAPIAEKAAAGALPALAGWLPVIAGGAATGGLGVPILALIMLLGKGAAGAVRVVHEKGPVVFDQIPPSPQILSEISKYVPVQVPSEELGRIKLAMDEFVKRYPGSMQTVQMIQSWAEQMKPQKGV